MYLFYRYSTDCFQKRNQELKMSWRKITFIVVALIVLLGGSAALSLLFVSLKPEPPRKPEAEMKRFVKADTVEYSEIISSVSREGRVASGNEVMLVAEVSGRIETGDIVLKKGTSFKEGELLAVIYKDEVELALKARISRFLTAFTTILPDLKVDYPDDYTTFLKYFNSIQIDQNLPELPEINNEKLKIYLASQNILSEFYGIKQDEKRLGRHSLYAPFNGTFSQVNFEVGAYVNAGGQIAKMLRTDQLEIEVPVEVYLSEWIKIGDKVKLYSNDSIERSGVVARKSDFIDADTQSRSIFVQVHNDGSDKLFAGELNVVKFPGQLIPHAMEIPRSAVFNSNEVFTVVNGKLNKREINIIQRNETTFIFDGLEEGAKIVVEPLINVKENSAVGIFGEEQPKSQEKRGQRKPQTRKQG